MQSEDLLESIKHTRLKYAIKNTNVSVNLNTGRALAEVLGSSIGNGSFMINVNHVYNPALSNRVLSSFKNYWKFNIEQYLFRKLSTDRDQEEYEFIDDNGLLHIFKYLGHTGNVYRYYDTSGLNLILTTEGPNNVSVTSQVIQDDIGNQFIFDNLGRMTASISTVNPAIHKVYHYIGGFISEAYDNRNSDRKITFHYHANRISEVRFSNKGVVRKSFHYDYDSDNNLRTITRRGRKSNERANEHKTHIFYAEEAARLAGFYDTRDSEVIKINYRRLFSGFHIVDNVETGLGTITNAKSGVIRAGGALDIPFWGELKDIDLKPENRKERSRFTFLINHTAVRNDKNISLNYFFNRKGNLVSIMEDVGGFSELKKRPGVNMLSPGRAGTINGSGAQVISPDIPLTMENYFFLNKDAIISYRNEKFRQLLNFKVSFWMMLTGELTDNRIQIETISRSPGNTDISIGSFDNHAIWVWQLVEIDVRISGSLLDEINLNFLGSGRSVEIAAMKMYQAPSTTFYVSFSDGRNKIRIENIESIQYTNQNGKIVTEDINNDFYLTANDILASHKNLITSLIPPEPRPSEYIISLCDGTKKVLGNNCTFIQGSNRVTVSVGLEYRLGYFIEERSANDKIITITNFRRAVVADNNQEVVCIGMNQIATSEGRQSTTDTIVDLQGRLRREQDEYDAVTTYRYDLWGNMSQTMSHLGVSDQISITFNDAEYQSISRTPRNEVSSTFNEPLGERLHDTFIDFVQLTGLEDQISTYQIDYESNVFGDRLETVSDNLSGKNTIIYDDVGRVISIRPLSGSFYGYDYEYNEFGDLTKCYFVSGKGRDLLTETIIERNQNTITRKGFRSLNTEESDEMIVSFDNYGNVSKISENGTVTKFERQVVVESESVAGIKSYFDGFEKRQQDFEYTEDDTEVEKYKNGDFLTISSSGPDKVRHVLNNFRNNSGISETEITFDNFRYMNPRITSTNDLQVNQFNFRERVIYRYDGLGRIIEKDKPTPNGNLTTERIKYHPGTFIPMEISEVATMSIYVTYSRINVGRRVIESGVESRYFDNGPTVSTFSYDRAGRLTREFLKGTIALPGGERDYEYHPDGSLKSETRFGSRINYFYENGRLSNIGNDSSFDYDNLGNCVRIRGDNLTYTRFNLLESYTRGQIKTTYIYNSHGIRIKKENQNLNIDYYYDGAKLLGERDKITGNSFRYIYDIEEMIGFIAETHEGNHRHTETWYFIKDTLGSVVGLRGHRSGAVVFYEYDSWGESRVTGFDFLGGPIYEITNATHPNHIGLRNPIRWKSRYLDIESNLYYLEDRYYSPFMKMFITPCDPEEILYNINVVGFFNPYSIGSPVDFPKYDYNIFNSIPLSFDPDAMPRFNWRRFLISMGVLVGLYALSAASKGTLMPFLMKKKTATKLSLAAKLGKGAKGVGKAWTARGAADLTEMWLTEQSPYKSLQDAIIAYTISGVTGGISKVLPEKIGFVFGIVAQPIINEGIEWWQGDNFTLDNLDALIFNVITRSLTANFDNPVGQGFLRGVVRSARKGSV